MAAVGAYVTLAEAALLTQSDLVIGVIEEVVREGGILDMIPTRTVKGTNLTYNRENVLPSGTFHSIADSWLASEDIDLTQVTTTLAIHGDEKRLDDFVKKTYSSKQDQMAVVTQQTSRGIKQRVERALIYEATAFTGIHGLATTNQTQSLGSGSTGAAGTVTALNRMLDLVRPQADILLCPFRLAQRMDQVQQGVNSSAVVQINAGTGKADIRLGGKVTYWRDVPIKRSDYMATPDTGAFRETIASGTYSAETGGATASAFGIRWGEPEDGGVFLAIGDELFKTVGPYQSENFNGEWLRIVSYLATGVGSTRALGRCDGITDVAITA